MKQWITGVLIAIILGLSVWDAISDSTEQHYHDDFFNEVREFMSAGGRNTAAMGQRRDRLLNELCSQQNAIAGELYIDQINCAAEVAGAP